MTSRPGAASARRAVHRGPARLLVPSLVCLAVAVAACSGASGPSGSTAPSAVASSPQTASPAASPSSGIDASPGSDPSAEASAADASATDAVPWDPTLSAMLPATIGASEMIDEADGFAASASDPGLIRDMLGGAAGSIFDTTTGDYAVTFLYRLRPGVFSDAWFRSWRDTFDSGVCAQAGGVSGHAEATIGGHLVYIGDCAQGVHTYHLHLVSGGDDVVISLQSLGSQRLGEQVIGGLKP
jgi:hypothetical protein